MARKYSYYLPNMSNLLNKGELLEYLKYIRIEAICNGNKVENPKHIEDLKYYLKFIYVDSERIISTIDIENSMFFLDFPPVRRNMEKCLWITDGKNKIHFSTSYSGLRTPTAKNNFYSYFTYLIQEFKNNIKKILVKQKGITEATHLWHSSPTTTEIIDEFIELNCLSDKLDDIISPNGLGNNLPFLMQDY
ncbi:hypothetical protein ACWIWA_10865, partial [Ursidibacter arcticus]